MGARRYFERETELWAGNEILRERERERRSLAVLLERARSADAPGTRKVVFPVAGSTTPLRRARGRPGRSPFAPVALSSPRPSYVARYKGNDRIAPIFRHHPGFGGHRTPSHVPITVFTPPGALSHTRGRGPFFVILGGKISTSCQNRVFRRSPLPPRLPGITKQKNTKMGGRDTNMMNGHEAIFRAGDETLGGKRNFERERERCGRLQFCLRGHVVRTPPGRGRYSPQVAASTTPLRRARGRPGRGPFAPVALSSPRPSNVARYKSNDLIAPIFRHHPGFGGHRTPSHVPITVFTPPGAL